MTTVRFTKLVNKQLKKAPIEIRAKVQDWAIAV